MASVASAPPPADPASIWSIDGKFHKLTIHPDANACGRCFFNCVTWQCLGPVVAMQKVIDDTHVVGHSASLCGDKCGFYYSPCQCCPYCGWGPMAGQWKWILKDGKWEAEGSVFVGECCMCCTHHEGDWFLFDAEHNAMPGKPLVGYAGPAPCAGGNPWHPPCFDGQVFAALYEVQDRRGTPIGSTGAPEGVGMVR